MPGVHKLKTISTLCHSHKPHQHSNWVLLRTLTSSATAGRLNYSITITRGWWRGRITHRAHPAHFNTIRHPPSSSSSIITIFPGQKFLFSSTPEEKGQGHSCNNNNTSNNSGLATAMGHTYSSDDENEELNHHNDGKKSLPPPPSDSAKLLTLPTILTIGRVAAVPLLVSTFYTDSWWGPSATTVIFVVAAVTDWLDGYLARKMNLGTVFGAFLDPVADKLMVAATLVLLCTRPVEVGALGQAPWLLTIPAIAIIGREITMSAVREWAASQDGKLSEAVAVNNLGKWKTATQMTALTILLATRDSSLIGAGTLATSGIVLLYISAWLSLWSLVVYMRKIWKVLVM